MIVTKRRKGKNWAEIRERLEFNYGSGEAPLVKYVVGETTMITLDDHRLAMITPQRQLEPKERTLQETCKQVAEDILKNDLTVIIGTDRVQVFKECKTPKIEAQYTAKKEIMEEVVEEYRKEILASYTGPLIYL